jgi:hypothetical protein
MATIFVLIATAGPTVRYWFSGERAVVDALGSSSLYVGQGAEPVVPATVAGIIGSRPLAIVSLTASDPLAKDSLGTCEGVVAQLPTLIVTVIVDGSSAAGCEGKDVRFGSSVDSSGWDYVFWQTQSGADSLLVGDVPAIGRQLALAYDAEVKGGRVIGAVREFSTPRGSWLLTGLLAVAVVACGVGAFVLLRWAVRRQLAGRDRRRVWNAERDRIDGELGDVAMVMVGIEPADRDRKPFILTVSALSDDYRRALDSLEKAHPGDDLTELADRVRRIQESLDTAAVGDRKAGADGDR